MKIEVRLNKIGPAGFYELITKENDITEDVRLKLGKGQPSYYAKLEAERLAVALNCDLYEDGKLIRETINKGEEK